MEFIDSKMPPNGTLRLTSDWQVGSVTFDETKIEPLLRPVLTEKDYRLALIGDLVDAITHKDKRFTFDDLDERYSTPLDQLAYVEETLRPVAKKVLSLGAGNHEFAIRDMGDPTKLLARNLGVPYGGYNALLRVNKATRMLLWHGRASLNSNLPNAMQRNFAVKRALVTTNNLRWGRLNVDLVAQGHVNQLAVVSPAESAEIQMDYDWDKRHIKAVEAQQDPRWFAVCGSLQRMYVAGRTSYVEMMGRTYPLPLGCVDVEFRRSKIVDVRTVRL